MSESNSPNQLSDPPNPPNPSIASSHLSDSDETLDSDQSSCLTKEQTASQVIEKEIHSFLNCFCTPQPIDSVPILLFPQNLGRLINKCIRYYASICNLAAFYIEVHGTQVLIACSNDHLRQHYIDHYKKSFLSLPEDCEPVSVTDLYNCIVRNKKRNKLRRNLTHEFEQDDLVSECSDQEPFASFTRKTSKASVEVDAKGDQNIKDELVMKSNLNVNAAEFVSQRPADYSVISDDYELVIPDDVPKVYSFLNAFSVESEKNLTHPYFFTPESSKDFAYNVTSFEFEPPISSFTRGLSLDLPIPTEQSHDSAEVGANPLIESMEKHDNSTESTPKLVVDSFFPMRQCGDLVSSLKVEPAEQNSSPKSELVPIIKDLQKQESLASVLQSPSKCSAKSTPMYFASTPKSRAPFIEENIQKFPLRFSASTSYLNISPLTSSSTTESSPPIQQPDSSMSYTKDLWKNLQSYGSDTQPLSNLTSPPICRQLFSNTKSELSGSLNESSSNLTEHSSSVAEFSSAIQDQLTISPSTTYYSAELSTSSKDLPHARVVESCSILPEQRVAKNIPVLIVKVQPTISFETPLAPSRSAPQLQLIATPQTNSQFSSSVELSPSSSDSPSEKTTNTSKLTTPTTTYENSEIHGEFSSNTSTISEEVDDEFMGESKNYIDYIIDYEGFLQQTFDFVKGSPLLVRSLRSTYDFRYLLKKHECIIELYNIPAFCSALEILHFYREKPRCLIWCDSSHALLTTQSVSQANRALKLSHKYIKSRPIADGSPVATVIACSYNLEPMFDSLDKWIEDSFYS